VGCCEARYSINETSKLVLSSLHAKKIDFNPLCNVKSTAATEHESFREQVNGLGQTKVEDERLEGPEENNSIEEPVNNNEKRLILKVLEGKCLNRGDKIKIESGKVNDVLPLNPDRFVFGKAKEQCDYIFPAEENVGELQFELKYDKTIGEYCIKDLKNGTGSFIKINKKQMLDHDYIFSFCNTHIFVYKVKEDNVLNLRFLFGMYKKKIFTYNPKDHKLVRIGRNKAAEIVYKEDSVSRIQVTFAFENNKWYIYDGIKDKPSTNGLWALASKKMNLADGMIIKTGNTTFKARIKSV